MTEERIPRLVLALAAPTIASMLITSLYSMADTYFVGLLGSASATGAVGVAFPLMAVLQAVGFMFGQGSGNHIARTLGAQDVDNAVRMAATGFWSALITGVLLALGGLLGLNSLVFLLGSTETIAPYATDYLFYILLGAPWLVSSIVINNQLRFQGSAFYAMVGILSGSILNIALDPLFIFTFGMGVGGAALATAVSQIVSFAVLLAGTYRGGNIRMSLRHFTPTREVYRDIMRGGVPSLFRQGLGSVAIICLNTAAGAFGDAAIAALSIVNRVVQFMASAIIGFGQGFQPVCGYNYGAKRYGRVRQAYWFCVKGSFGFLALVAAVVMLFATQIIRLFLADSPEVTRIGALTLQLQCSFLPLFSVVAMSNMMLQTMGIAGRASLMAASRQGLFLIPCVLILPRLFGLLGLQISQTVADVLAFLLTVVLTRSVLNDLKERQKKQDLLMEEEREVAAENTAT
ncbi:MAG: MATE family efflux transporter [Clostridia bacterium]|nr:MATE family efflux transporter [Clostridia bacterium]